MENEIKVNRVWIDETNISIETQEGKIKSHPLEWFPRLLNATSQERNRFELSPFGIHWPDLDEDLSFEGFFHFKMEPVVR